MNILLVGGAGRMGKQVRDLKQNHNIVALDKSGGCEYSSFDGVKEKIDVVLDFSAPAALEDVLDFCLKNKTPLVSAVTGYNENQILLLKRLSANVPVIHSGNFSLGLNIVNRIVKSLAKSLPDSEVEICETHHNKKKDAPSGSAKMLLETVKNSGINKIGVHSLRGGDVVGEHSVIFFCEGERIEIKHIADSRNIFALGAIKACEWIVGKESKLYSIEDMLKA